MKGGILAAWLLGLSVVSWRIVAREHRVPSPGAILGITGLFLAGAVITEWVPKSESLVLATLVGLDVAAVLNVLPMGLGGEISAAQKAEATAVSGSGQGQGGTQPSSVNRPVRPATEGG